MDTCTVLLILSLSLIFTCTTIFCSRTQHSRITYCCLQCIFIRVILFYNVQCNLLKCKTYFNLYPLVLKASHFPLTMLARSYQQIQHLFLAVHSSLLLVFRLILVWRSVINGPFSQVLHMMRQSTFRLIGYCFHHLQQESSTLPHFQKLLRICFQTHTHLFLTL